jgi:hypothetical protein
MDAFAELLGFASGAALLIPAFRVNNLLALASELNTIAKDRDASAIERELTPTVAQRLAAAAAKWCPSDQWWLRVGAVMLTFSFLIKFVLQMQK